MPEQDADKNAPDPSAPRYDATQEKVTTRRTYQDAPFDLLNPAFAPRDDLDDQQRQMNNPDVNAKAAEGAEDEAAQAKTGPRRKSEARAKAEPAPESTD